MCICVCVYLYLCDHNTIPGHCFLLFNLCLCICVFFVCAAVYVWPSLTSLTSDQLGYNKVQGMYPYEYCIFTFFRVWSFWISFSGRLNRETHNGWLGGRSRRDWLGRTIHLPKVLAPPINLVWKNILSYLHKYNFQLGQIQFAQEIFRKTINQQFRKPISLDIKLETIWSKSKLLVFKLK